MSQLPANNRAPFIPGPLAWWIRVIAAVSGTTLLVLGVIATFVADNDVASTGLAAFGIVLLLFALLGDRISSLRVGNVEVQLLYAQLLKAKGEIAAYEGDVETGNELREQAAEIALQASSRAAPLARASADTVPASVSADYEALRLQEAPGPKRTAAMERLIARARREVKDGRYSKADVEKLAAGDEGQRVEALALIQERPEWGALDFVLDAIEHSRSAFEQYHALKAAEAMLNGLNEEERRRLAEVCRSAPFLDTPSDRRALRDRLLQRLGG
jgi:hypothetical protein